jgi:hypothetical protein
LKDFADRFGQELEKIKVKSLDNFTQELQLEKKELNSGIFRKSKTLVHYS